MKIKEIPKEIRPREKAISYGIESLSDQELLALIIGSGVANHSALDIADDLLKENLKSLTSLFNSNLESLSSNKLKDSFLQPSHKSFL